MLLLYLEYFWRTSVVAGTSCINLLNLEGLLVSSNHIAELVHRLVYVLVYLGLLRKTPLNRCLHTSKFPFLIIIIWILNVILHRVHAIRLKGLRLFGREGLILIFIGIGYLPLQMRFFWLLRFEGLLLLKNRFLEGHIVLGWVDWLQLRLRLERLWLEWLRLGGL